MASTRSLFSSFIFLLSLLVIVSAGDYGYVPNPDNDYVSTTKPENVKPEDAYKPKPESEVLKHSDGYDPKPKYGEKPKPDTINPEDHEYSSKSEFDAVKPNDKYGDSVKPDVAHGKKPKLDSNEYEDGYSPKAEFDVVKPDNEYGNSVKPDVTNGQKPKSDTNKLEDEYDDIEKNYDGYSQTPKPDVLNNTYDQGPKAGSKKPEDGYSPKPGNGYGLKPENPFHIGVEGLVLCKSGSSYIPVEGAVARIICSALDHNGYETASFSCLVSATDAKGYFFKTFSLLGLGEDLKLKECKVKLEKSPLKSCNVPTDVNKGITGALISSYRILHDKKIKLYSVGPFFYTSEPKPTPTGY